jgi:hypothetical protein
LAATVSVSRVLRAVSASAAAISSRMRAGKAAQLADRLEPDVVLVELGDLLLQRAQEQIHEDRNLVRGAPPVLAREREQRQVFDPALDRRAHGGAHRFHALAVTGDARQQPLLRPAAVAIHDDRHVTRHRARLGDLESGALEHLELAIRGGRSVSRPIRSPSGRLPSPA